MFLRLFSNHYFMDHLARKTSEKRSSTAMKYADPKAMKANRRLLKPNGSACNVRAQLALG